MRKKAEYSLRERLQYHFDNWMSKGTVAMVLLLFAVTFIVVAVCGVILGLFDNQPGLSLGKAMWMTLMHTLDAGTLGGDDGSVLFLALMMIVTLCGIFITSMLIGIVNTGLQSKLEDLRKGRSRVLEKDHTVILGFTEEALTVIGELILANESEKRGVVVVMDDIDKSEMEESIRKRFPEMKSTTVICRQGKLSSIADLEMCSVAAARSVILNTSRDTETIKAILAVSNLVEREQSDTYITAVIREKENLEAAAFTGGDHIRILHFESTIARIMAHSSRHAGMSAVFQELFDYDGDEIYIEPADSLVGVSFAQAQLRYPKAIVMGIQRGERSLLNPPAGTVIEAGDRMIVLAEDNGLAIPEASAPSVDRSRFSDTVEELAAAQHLLVLGCNKLLYRVLMEMDKYVADGSRVVIAAKRDCLEGNELPSEGELRHIEVVEYVCPYLSGEVMSRLITTDIDTVLVLTDDGLTEEEADAETLLSLLHLRSFAQKHERNLHVISEMCLVENQELARVTRVNDFVLSSNITALVMTQVSQNIALYDIFEDLLDEEGSEIYMKPAKNYVKLGTPVDFYTVAAAASEKNEVFVGYKSVQSAGRFTLCMNPLKSKTHVFAATDSLIVIAED